ncbi:NhaA family Na+:H+ antiporter [Nocardioides luteus]|uniref:Na(+)/H(+) antiporter NhaA n=1 Tax=Nocardioides luteus TaxID=1844 RepID=A0ABQ5SSA6_9ACTN|nr:Na+/H+ antiporter NhaA [Nocardioides luteus]MDR7313354.1 NhaA family Na+:H+ antiporter [Nocardioides luteus]GGR60408.1 Na(+)/H(+) antiporter NhaA [Nocardioides luteus]GLJ66419.1 Na(+)/H(+) antiporter NhaA [Nocardioides luteus]
MSETRNRLFTRTSWLETSRTAEILRAETTGGILLIIGAVIAVILANSPLQETYEAVRDFRFGPSALHLDLSVGTWAADGLLAIFFFVAGLELKREFVAGDLRDPRRAALPIAAAVGGMVAPALIYVAVNTIGGGSLAGWATPVATDIAFAVAILAVISTHLPAGLRTFLLTLAVVDDLLGITIIAIFFTSELHIGYLLLALIPIGLFALLVQRRITSPWLLIPLALVAWALVHSSGVHATVAGVVLGFTVPVVARDPEAKRGLAEHLEHLTRPISAGVAVPIFAFFAAGVSLGGWDGVTSALHDPITLGIILGLVVGKTIGIAGSTWLLATFTRASLDDDLAWTDVIGMAMLAGIGFTVSLLIGELAFGSDHGAHDHMKVGVLFGSVLASLLATIILRARNRVYRRIEELETTDADNDGVPDVFEEDQGRDR